MGRRHHQALVALSPFARRAWECRRGGRRRGAALELSELGARIRMLNTARRATGRVGRPPLLAHPAGRHPAPAEHAAAPEAAEGNSPRCVAARAHHTPSSSCRALLLSATPHYSPGGYRRPPPSVGLSQVFGGVAAAQQTIHQPEYATRHAADRCAARAGAALLATSRAEEAALGAPAECTHLSARLSRRFGRRPWSSRTRTPRPRAEGTRPRG